MANRKSFYEYTNTPPHPPSLHLRAKNTMPPIPLQTACAGPWETLTARLSIYIASNRKPNRPSRKHYGYGKPRRHRVLRGARRSGLGSRLHWLGGGYFILTDHHAGFIHYSRVHFYTGATKRVSSKKASRDRVKKRKRKKNITILKRSTIIPDLQTI